MLQAFQGDAHRLGFVRASTPLIFAQAAQQKIVAVAGWAPSPEYWSHPARLPSSAFRHQLVGRPQG